MIRALTATLAAMIAVASVAATSACSPSTTSRPHRGGTLQVVLAPGALAHIDPQRVMDPDMSAVLGAFVVRTLTTRSGDGTSVVPDLAAGPPDVSSDRTTWTYRLRTDVLFDNARPLSCADVKHGIARNFARDLGNDGTGAVAVLDIPTDPSGGSAYRGPYVPAGGVDADGDGRPDPGTVSDTAAFDHAVECSSDGTAITFRLSAPVGRFDEVLAQPAFAPVPIGSDIGADYEQRPVGTGPYRVEERSAGSVTLVRSLHWDANGDSGRPAYPDRIVVTESSDPDATAQSLLIADDAVRDAVGPAVSRPVLDRWIADGQLAARGTSATIGTAGTQVATGPDRWVRYVAIDSWRVPDVAVRRAIQAAINRAAVRDALVSSAGGDLTDGLVAPGLVLDNAPTGVWSAFSTPVGPDGSSSVARSLLAGGVPGTMGALRLDHPDTAPDAAAAAIVVADLRAIGLDVTARAIPVESYAQHLRTPDAVGELAMVDYAPSIPAGITVVDELLAPTGLLNLSHWGDDAALRAIELTEQVTDRAQQGDQVADLVADAVLDGAVVPLFSYRVTRIAGAGVGGADLSPATGTWAYAELFVR